MYFQNVFIQSSFPSKFSTANCTFVMILYLLMIFFDMCFQICFRCIFIFTRFTFMWWIFFRIYALSISIQNPFIFARSNMCFKMSIGFQCVSTEVTFVISFIVMDQFSMIFNFTLSEKFFSTNTTLVAFFLLMKYANMFGNILWCQELFS